MQEKSLTTYFDESYAKLWMDEFIPCVYTILRTPISIEQLEQLTYTSRNAMGRLLKRRKGNIFSVVNFSLCSNLTVKLVDQYLNQVIIPELNSRRILKLFVRPECKNSSMILQHALSKLSNQNIEMFTTFEGALEEINKQSEVRLEKKEKAKDYLFKIFKI